MQTPAAVYMPSAERMYRVAWYGGESTQLHFQKFWNVYDLDTNEEYTEWTDRDVRTLDGGIPSSMKELLMEMEDYYHCGCEMEQERIMQMM